MTSDRNRIEKLTDRDSSKVDPGRNGLVVALLVFSLLILTSILTLAQDGGGIPIKTDRLSENVLFFNTGETSALTNVVAIRTDDGVVVIDTSPSFDSAVRIRSSIEEVFGQVSIPYVLYTHAAFDHTIGIEAFDGAVSIGQVRGVSEIEQINGQLFDPGFRDQIQTAMDGLRQQVEDASDDPRRQKAMKEMMESIEALVRDCDSGILFTVPTITFDDSLTLRAGGTTFDINTCVISYSESDVLIHIPEERVLVVGDVFNKGRLPMISERSDIPRWKELFQPYLSGERPLDHIIGGHGDLLALEDIRSQMEYIDALYRSIRSAREDGVDTEGIRAQHAFELFGHLSGYDTTFHGMPGNIHESNVQNIITMIENELEGG
ncbi:MBL fold metallo-hydrolase [Gemmatimonadota bacterium]